MSAHHSKPVVTKDQINTLAKRITIQNTYLQTLQKITALVTVLIPTIGTLLAIGSLKIIGCSLTTLMVMMAFYVLTFLGITIGYHRYFSHCSFRTFPIIRAGLAILGSMAAQGPVIHWISNHRRHHQFCDQVGDPHSPHGHSDCFWGQLNGFWHAHVGWTFTSEVTNAGLFAKDLLRDPWITTINKFYWLWVLLGLVLPSIFSGLLMGSWIGVLQGFLWGGLVRIFLAHHDTWSINSITHLWGSRPFSTHEQSTNNIWLAIPTFGESWHHNHHAFPNSAYFGLEWWQIDMGGWVIRCLKGLTWVWAVKYPTDEIIAAKRL